MKNMEKLFLALFALFFTIVPLSRQAVGQTHPDWYELNLSVQPSERSNPLMAYDSGRGVIVLYGSRVVPSDPLTDTWEWDSRSWKQIKIKGTGVHRHGGMAYDAKRKMIVLFGGLGSANEMDGDTWLYDGSKWSKAFPAHSPSPRDQFTLVYDSKRKRIVLYGGQTISSDPVMGDLWEWDGKDWTLRGKFDPTPEGGEKYGPRSRFRHAAAYDSDRGVMVVQGGVFYFPENEGSAAKDTWEWNGSAWTKRSDGGIGYRALHSMVYDNADKRCLSFGGVYSSAFNLFKDELWEWNGSRWKKVDLADAPAERSTFGMVFDADRRETVLFGGTQRGIGGAYGLVSTNDTWVYRYQTDLFVKSIRAAPDTFAPGNTVTLRALIKNKWKGTSHEGKIHFYFSLDKIKDNKDIIIKRFKIEEIAYREKIKFKKTIQLQDVPAGKYYIIAQAFEQGPNYDRNPVNNTAVSRGKVVVR